MRRSWRSWRSRRRGSWVFSSFFVECFHYFVVVSFNNLLNIWHTRVRDFYTVSVDYFSQFMACREVGID